MTSFNTLRCCINKHTCDSMVHDYRYWPKSYEIEILVNTFYMYISYGLLIIGIRIHKMGRIRDYRSMKHRITSVSIIIIQLLLLTFSQELDNHVFKITIYLFIYSYLVIKICTLVIL